MMVDSRQKDGKGTKILGGLALAAILLAGATEQGMSQWLPTFTERVLGYSKAAGGMTLAGFLIAMVAGRWGAAMLGHKVRPLWLMYGCGVGCVVLFVVATVCPAPPVGVAACVGVGLCCSCLWPTLLGVTADRFPHGGASMFSLLAAAGNAGCFIMPWTIGFVATRHGLRTGLGTGALAPVLLLAAVAVVAASTHQRPST